METALYMRMSTDKQENSIESQQKVLREYAKRNGMRVVREYVDEGISGRQAVKRPAFMQMIDDSDSRLFCAVLIFDSSRFARNLEESIVYKAKLKKNGVALISVTEPSLDDDSALITDAMLGALNEMHSRKLSKNVKRGMEFKNSAGYFTVAPPYGYATTKSPGVIKIVPHEAEIVKMIFDLFINESQSYKYIARKINLMGVPRPKNGRWKDRDIKRAIKKITYAGFVKNNDNAYLGKHEAIIAKDVFDKAQQLALARPSGGVRSHGYKHYLSGVLHCAFCGKTLTYNANPRGDRFRCGGNAKGFCDVSSDISVSKSERLFREMIICAMPGVKPLVFRKATGSEPLREIDTYKNSIALIEKKLERATNAYMQGIDTIDEYRGHKKTLLSEKNELEKQLLSLDSPKAREKEIEAVKVGISELLDLIENESFTAAQKNNAVKKIVNRIIYDKKNASFEVFFNF